MGSPETQGAEQPRDANNLGAVFSRRCFIDGKITWRVHISDTPWTAETSVLDADAQRSLGLIAYWAALLELHLEWALLETIGEYPDSTFARIMTQELAASQIVTKLRRFVKMETIGDTRASLALDAANLALQERNRVLHGAMGGHLSPDTAALYNRRKVEAASISKEELASAAEQIFDATMMISEIDWDPNLLDRGEPNND